MPKQYTTVLSIAGSDSSGGAGVQADLKTFSALGCYGMTVITALTAQNTTGVKDVHAVPASFVKSQMDAVLSDIGADAVKIGMLFSAEAIMTVADALKACGARNIVLDPVMISQSGHPLLQNDAVNALRTHLLPVATVLTPNLPEAGWLLDRDVDVGPDMEKAARELTRFGSRNVLLKGGHGSQDKSCDILYCAEDDRVVMLEAERIATRNNHGTGCTLSSALAAYLARGRSVEKAARAAKTYITTAIQAGTEYHVGKGHGPVHHFHGFW